jgi:hypothetical protein
MHKKVIKKEVNNEIGDYFFFSIFNWRSEEVREI